MILVTGAMGRVGSATVRALRSQDVPVRAMVPSRARVPWLQSLGADIAEGDYDDGRSLGVALDGVDTVILISRPQSDQVAVQERVIDACASTGITRVIKLSVASAAPDAQADVARWHWRTEQHLRHSVQEPVIVRATRLMQDLMHHLPLVLAHHMLVGCQGDGRVPDVDARDVGEVLAGVATATKVPREPLVATGGEALTRAQMTAMLSHALRVPLRFVPCAAADLAQTLLASGLPTWQVEDLVAFEESAREGVHTGVTDTVATWSGHAPRSFAAFADELATSLRYANAPAASPSAVPTVVAAGA